MGYVPPFIKQTLSPQMQTIVSSPSSSGSASSSSQTSSGSRSSSSSSSFVPQSSYVPPMISQTLSPTMQSIISGEPVRSVQTYNYPSNFVGPPAPPNYPSQQSGLSSQSPIPSWYTGGLAGVVANPLEIYKFKKTGEYVMAERQKYVQSGIAPSWLSNQISVPSAISQAGVGNIYSKLAVESFFGGFNTKQTEYKLSKSLSSNYWYMSTQPIWKESATSDRLLSFGELKSREPALYLTQGAGGVWSPKFDVVRWRSEWESSVGMGGSVTARMTEVPLRMFDIDYYFAGNKKEYLASKLYESHMSMMSGDIGRIATTWAKMQVPAYTNFILPAAGGYVMGKIFTGMKLAGGFAKASTLLKAGYAGAIGYGAFGVGYTGYKFATEGVNAKSIASLVLGLTVGSAGYMGGSASALSSFKSKYPNISWGREGSPVLGEKYVSFAHEKISGPGLGGKTVVPYRYGFYKISQMFKPSGELNQYISFPEAPSPFGARGSLTMFGANTGTTDTMVGYAEGTGNYFRNMWGGQRAFSYRSGWGMQKQAVVGLDSVTGVSYGGTLKMSSGKVPFELRPISSDVSAMQSVFPSLQFSSKNIFASDLSFKPPLFSYSPSGFGSFVSPSFSMGVQKEISLPSLKMELPRFEFDVDQRLGYLGGVSPISSNVNDNVPRFESGFRYRPVFSGVYPGVKPVVTPISSVFSVNQSISKPYSVSIPRLGLGVKSFTGYDVLSVGKKVSSFNAPKISPMFVPSRFLGGYGGGAMGGWGRYLRSGYRFRKHKTPTLEDILKGW
jgi:hypothetical protein